MTDSDNFLAMFILMDLVATAIKTGDPLGKRFAESGAVTIMPDGVALYHREKFIAVMREMVAGQSLGGEWRVNLAEGGE